MLDESLDAVFSMVEKAFMRLQAGDVLVLCLEKDDTAPMQKLVEGLVLAGPQSLNALREIRVEVTTRKVEFHPPSFQPTRPFASWLLRLFASSPLRFFAFSPLRSSRRNVVHLLEQSRDTPCECVSLSFC